MPLFEFEAGRLVPAQAGHTIDEPVEEAVLDAVRDQLLELLGIPVLPVAWHEDDGARWLTAMAADGRAVGLEVVSRLDAQSLVGSLARLGRTTTTSWAELAASYPRGAAAFRRDWQRFRESQPPHQSGTARLHVVAARIEDDVRPAVLALAGAGVVVHELSARVMTSGRLFLDVTEVRTAVPPLPWLEPGAARSELSATPATDASAVLPVATDASAVAAGTEEPGVAGTTDASVAAPTRDLQAIGQSLEAAAPLVWAADGVRHEARLTPDGWIELDERTFGDPALAAAALGAGRDTDAWSGWRFGEEGPSLHEARTELRAHRERRRRATAHRGGLRRRARRTRETIE